MEVTMNNQQLREYCHKNQIIVGLHSIASNDYIAARCCFYNEMLDQAYILASQAIEKELKCMLLLMDEDTDLNNIKSHSHDLEKLMDKIQSVKDMGLQAFNDINERLNETYLMFRYPDNFIKKMNGYKKYSHGGEEINEIDKYFIHLLDTIPLPPEVKYRTGFLVTAFREETYGIQPTVWAKHNNLSFNQNKKRWYNEYLLIKKHLYSSQ
ncbi:HEPN domain-containing protein [Muricauda sp. SCSIO 64092]|uniref:HEPN domain-containing protein n=1 Tax=Allomuricauda sp. SCSIO 64092 TaxID=2908842 RepID=UPI001FF418A5|nr:HEPN domain-containing protein [Muricauda sp. SCSIO 64092]UOY08224.1 HEPN domain-containing protein [Muricauda sp. SCSIO 64092]